MRKVKSTRRSRLIRRVVLHRDGFKCRFCDEPALGTHNCIPLYDRSRGYSKIELDQPWNRITVCDICHDLIHKKENEDIFLELQEWAARNGPKHRASQG